MWYVLCSTVDRSISDKFLAVLLILLLPLSSHSTAERRRVKERFVWTHCTSPMLAARHGPQCCDRNKPASLCSVTGEPSILASSHVLKLLPGFQLPKYQSINSLLSSLLSSSLAHHLNLLQQLRARKLQEQLGTSLTRRNDRALATSGAEERLDELLSPQQLTGNTLWRCHREEEPLSAEEGEEEGPGINELMWKGICGCMAEWWDRGARMTDNKEYCNKFKLPLF